MFLFEKKEIRENLEIVLEKAKKEIDTLSNAVIVGTDMDELVEYYEVKYHIDRIEIYKDNITKDLSEEQIKESNPLYNSENRFWEPEYYLSDGYKVTFQIPFDGDIELLYLRPTTHYMCRFEVDNIVNPTKTECGKIVFSLKIKKDELGKSDDSNSLVQNKFENAIRTYYDTVDRLNKEVDSFNDILVDRIQGFLNVRKKKANDYIEMRERLSLPLEFDDRAPNTHPIILKRNKGKRNTKFPDRKKPEEEYAISDDDYNNINNIIRLSCISMEKTARTFTQLHEEDLRDMMLSNLNTHYKNMASGETFNKIGKTDIYIPFENKAAYIAECKVWHGKKALAEAINQLCGYTTWRDTKTSLILFNKDNKSFNTILNTVDGMLEEMDVCDKSTKTEHNEWTCTFSKEIESNDKLTIHIMLFDLYVG